MKDIASQETEAFAEFRATPDKVWRILLSIHGEIRDHRHDTASATGRIESAVRRLARTVEFGIAIGVGLALHALYF